MWIDFRKVLYSNSIHIFKKKMPYWYTRRKKTDQYFCYPIIPDWSNIWCKYPYPIHTRSVPKYFFQYPNPIRPEVENPFPLGPARVSLCVGTDGVAKLGLYVSKRLWWGVLDFILKLHIMGGLWSDAKRLVSDTKVLEPSFCILSELFIKRNHLLQVIKVWRFMDLFFCLIMY